jgi:hypothetical protein
MIGGMTTRPCTRGLWAGVALALMIVTPSAMAEDAATQDADARYRTTLKDALAEYDANHFEEARILFRRAHEINPNARTFRSIGMASFELRDYVAAVRALSAALMETRKPLSAEQRSHAQGLLERSRMYVDIYALKISPADARVLIDGRAPDPEPDGTVLLGFGSHNLEVSKPGFVLRTMTVNVRGGERKDLAMTLERKPVSTVQPTAVATEVARSSTSGAGALSSHGEGHSAAAWFIAAGGAALLSGGSAGMWILENKELTNCHRIPDRCNNGGTIVSMRNLYVGATLGTGAAAITLAVIGMLRGDSAGTASSARSALSCTVLPSGVLCAKSF